MASEFVHLHVHSQYTFLTSSLKLGGLGARARDLGMPAVAVTDLGNMFGAVKHWKACKEAGVQPILGCEINLVRPEGRGATDHLVLLAATNQGYRNLVRLVSLGHLQPAGDVPSVRREDVARHAEGLICLTGCLGGVVAQRVLGDGPDVAAAALGGLAELFAPGHTFVELQDHGFAEQPVLNGILVEAARRLDLPVVATNDVHFLDRDDADAQVYLECVRLGRTVDELSHLHHGSPEMFLKSPAQMAARFGATPEALSNTLRVAEMCAGLDLELGRPMLPSFPVPEGHTVDSWFRHLAHQGLTARLGEQAALGRSPDEAAYRARLAMELEVIVGMKYPGYFLIVWDFIRHAKEQGIPVGPGRGSGAGSLVAWSLGITDLDPIPYQLLFERFLNPERVSMPDFDIDFCMARRDEVIAYVSQKYGAASVGQIATYQNLKARSVIKDVARTMGFPAPEAQAIASLVPDLGQGKTATIAEALEQEPRLLERSRNDPRVETLLGIAKKLEGLTRHAGMHAAGIVISEGPLEDHVPVFRSDASTVTQYDKDDVEAAGLVKFDFLGLKTLTVLDVAERLVNARPDRQGRPLALRALPLDDADTYRLISSGDTTGVFQLESSGMQEKILKPLRPDCFEDIVAAVALYRPGPLGTGMIEDFIQTKHKKKAPRRLHPLVDGVLAPTYGVPVYQEQVMQIAQHLSGYTLGGADLLRRAMGKKKKSEMDKQLAQFVAGAVQNGVAEEQALAIFREIEGFASYGFNKSHSAAYALITYYTAYLKAHYPTEFFAATLTADRDKIDKVVRTVNEARAWGAPVLPPDINASAVDFTVVYAHPAGDGPARGPGKLRDRLAPRIRFGLGALRGVGQSALESVFEARRAGGPFRDLFDFAARVDARRINKGVLESLIQAGAFDTTLQPLGVTRAQALASVDRALERSRSASRDRESGQTSLLGLLTAAPARKAPAREGGPAPGGHGIAQGGATTAASDYPRVEPWDRVELLRREKQAIGCYVSGHPLHRYGAKLARIGAAPTAELGRMDDWAVVSVAGMPEAFTVRVFKGGSGGRAAFFELEDTSGRVRCKLRADRIEAVEPLVASGEALLVHGKLQFPMGSDEAEEGGEREPTLLVDSVERLAEAVLRATRSLVIRLDAEQTDDRQLTALRGLLEAAPGPCPVDVVMALPAGAEATLSLVRQRVLPTDAMLSALEKQLGEVVELR